MGTTLSTSDLLPHSYGEVPAFHVGAGVMTPPSSDDDDTSPYEWGGGLGGISGISAGAPESSGTAAGDFPHFPLVRYPLRIVFLQSENGKNGDPGDLRKIRSLSRRRQRASHRRSIIFCV